MTREPLAQPVEHVTFNHGAEGSSPSRLTNDHARVAELADALDLGSNERFSCGFKSHLSHQKNHAGVAQW